VEPLEQLKIPMSMGALSTDSDKEVRGICVENRRQGKRRCILRLRNILNLTTLYTASIFSSLQMITPRKVQHFHL